MAAFGHALEPAPSTEHAGETNVHADMSEGLWFPEMALRTDVVDLARRARRAPNFFDGEALLQPCSEEALPDGRI